MSVGNIYKLSAIVLAAGQVPQIQDTDYRPGISELLERGTAGIDLEFAAVGEAKPMATFSSSALATMLGYVGLDGYAIAANTDMYFSKIAQGGLVASGSSHIKLTLALGMVFPRRLAASQGQPARLTYDLYAISSDGLTAPISISTGVALPTVLGTSELFTLGPVSINNTSLSAVQSVDWTFNPNMEVLGAEGHAYPTFCGVSTRQMTCAINGLDISALSTFGLNGLALTTFKSFFRKIAEGGVRVAEVTASHIKFSGTEGMLLPRGARGPNNRPLTGEWNIVPTFDGTNSTVAVSTGSAIS